MEGIGFLKERAKEFWEEGLRNFEESKFNLSAFHFEQAVQLYLKYLIGKKLGEWPKTHYLPELVGKLSEIYEKEEIKKFYKENEIFFDDLSDAYFTSRYYPRRFGRSLTEKLKENCEKFFGLIKKELGEEFL